MNRMMKDFLLVLGIMIGIMSQSTSAKTGGYVQTSYFSTDGGMASGAAESNVIGPDGIKKGQCSFTNKQGQYITIKYEETPNGQVTGSMNGGDHGAAMKDMLVDCRSSLSALQKGINQGIQESNAQFEENFQQQMAIFNRQQQSFADQQTDFFNHMQEFSRRFMFG